MKNFFDPKSVALIGATEREGAVGRVIFENLLKGRELRKIYPVNPNRESVLGVKCYKSIIDLPETVDLAIIATPAPTVPKIIEECGESGVKAVIIISAGFRESGEEGRKREEEVIRIARKYGIRILGPNCMGIIRPSASFNCTFFKKIPKAGSIAFLSQSGALGSAILDWAINADIGFSVFVSVGSMCDIDFGELIDYLGRDPETRSIIIDMEFIGDARRFISAARGFVRTKPIIVIKPGKYPESIKAAMSHSGALASEDLIYDAVFTRAGVVRVDEIKDLFNCATILDCAVLPRGPNLAIITNAGGPGVIATDALISMGINLAKLSDDTIKLLDEAFSRRWSRGNPVDIMEDASADRYDIALEACSNDPNIDGIIVIYTPQGAATPSEVAGIIIKHNERRVKPIIAVFLGGEEVEGARQTLLWNDVPVYSFPEEAIKTYMYMYQYARNLELLYETPDEIPIVESPPKNHLKLLIKRIAKSGRKYLTEEEAKRFLKVYGIEVTTPYIATNPEEAVMIASEIGYPVVMKIASEDIVHKSDVGGVKLNITSADEVRKAFNEIIDNVKKNASNAKINGVSIQKMITDHDYELIIGSKTDPVFGAVIIFGMGGVEAEFFKDIAIGLPPLNQTLARRLMEKTRIFKMLKDGYRNKPPANIRLLEEVLVKFSNLIVDFPEIDEIDINPLLLTRNEAVAVDARIVINENVANDNVREYSHLLITPYPTRYVQHWRLKDGTPVIIRPIRPEDEPLQMEMLKSLSRESMISRFFTTIKDITHDMLVRLCNIDYDREMAVVAEYRPLHGRRRIIGVSRLTVNPDWESGEAAVLVIDEFQGKGLGKKLLDVIIGIAKDKRLKRIYGYVLASNRRMLYLAKELGFKVKRVSPEECMVYLDIC